MVLQPQQFHEMSRDEFEAQPGTMFHGNPTGNFNQEGGPQGFHVGSKQAATDAVVARAGFGGYSDGSRIPAPFRGSRRPVDDPERPYTKSEAVAHPEHLRGGRIDSPMVNAPGNMGSYGKGTHGDVMANVLVAAINKRGETMRQGIYYKNASEDAGSTSAVVPSRQSWKTHEDYIVEARARGNKVPKRALKGYSQIPGQQRIF